jgi:hypothetical protein
MGRRSHKIYLLLEASIRTKMFTKSMAVVVVAALAAVLISSATLAAIDDANARKKSQTISQSNRDCSSCQNLASQIQGKGNAVTISASQG